MADWVLNGPWAKAVERPNFDEVRLPIGGFPFTLLKRFRAFALNVRL